MGKPSQSELDKRYFVVNSCFAKYRSMAKSLIVIIVLFATQLSISKFWIGAKIAF